jgi:hypothetical protein
VRKEKPLILAATNGPEEPPAAAAIAVIPLPSTAPP